MPPSRPPLFSPHAWRTTWPCSRSRSSRWRSSPCFQCCAAGFRWGSLLTFILPLCSRLFILFQTTPAPVQAGLTVALVLLALSLSARVSATAPWLYAAIFTFVTFAAPAMLVWAQQYKKYVVYPICRTRTSRPRPRANEDLCTAKSADNGTSRCPKSSSIWPQTSRPSRSSRRIIYSTSIVPSGSGSHTDRSHSFCPPPKPYNLPTRSLRRATNSRTVQGPAACQST